VDGNHEEPGSGFVLPNLVRVLPEDAGPTRKNYCEGLGEARPIRAPSQEITSQTLGSSDPDDGTGQPTGAH
jgi:hypothetical protein